jgi:hypothetical protein
LDPDGEVARAFGIEGLSGAGVLMAGLLVLTILSVNRYHGAPAEKKDTGKNEEKE